MTGNAEGVRAAVFDVFGTVVDWRGSVAREVEQILGDRIDFDWIKFAQAWRGRYQPSMEEIRAGRRDYTILDVLHRENLDYVLNELDMNEVDEATRIELNQVWRRLSPWPDVVAGLRRLKGDYIIGPCSNGNIALMVHLAKFADLPWDAILGAEITDAYKPDPQAYRGTVAALGLEPHQVMMVAAHNSDLAAAAAEGLRTGFVARPTEYGPGQTTDLVAENDWDVVADDFIGLAQALGC